MKKIPMRKCTACQELKSKRELIRIVRTPDKIVEIDLKGKKSGRGAYICYRSDCLQLAKKKKSLEKALDVKIEEEIYNKIQTEIEKISGTNQST
ncbi:MAG: RNase P modulator RnpM [Vulcanibacillus sp.]